MMIPQSLGKAKDKNSGSNEIERMKGKTEESKKKIRRKKNAEKKNKSI